MVIIKYKGKEYRKPVDWSEVPLNKALKIMSIEMPDRLDRLYKAKDQEEREKLAKEAQENGDFESLFPEYYGKIIELLTDIPKEVIDYMSIEDRTEFYMSFLQRFIFDLMTFHSDEPKVESFEWNGETYYLPKDLEGLGISIPMGNETAITFSEVSDLRSHVTQFSEGGQFAHASNIVAILCRKEGEKYDKQVMLERAKEFEDIPMNIVFSVFFYLVNASNIFTIITESYLRNQKKKVAEVLTGTPQS